MAKRHRTGELAVTLFPFLSILACVIGTLTLMIAALALGEMATQSPTREPVTREEDLQVLVERIDAESRSLGEALAAQRSLASVRDAIAARGFARDATPGQIKQQLADRRAVSELTAKREQLDQEVSELRAAAEVLETEIRNRSVLAEDAPVEILPHGTGSLLAPYFVETLPEGVRIRRKDGAWSEEWSLDDILERGRFKVFLEEVRVRGNATVIFLVRPLGVDTFRRAELLATSHYVRFGKLAIPGTGKIDFQKHDDALSAAGSR
ncbi:MAG: hypothetical protein ACI8W3_003678 [Myxococcota bacterium]